VRHGGPDTPDASSNSSINAAMRAMAVTMAASAPRPMHSRPEHPSYYQFDTECPLSRRCSRPFDFLQRLAPHSDPRIPSEFGE
jgi:hypothetical protein